MANTTEVHGTTIDLTSRLELAEVDALTTEILERDWTQTDMINLTISDYPRVWDALFEHTEPDDEDELADEARRCAEALRQQYDL